MLAQNTPWGVLLAVGNETNFEKMKKRIWYILSMVALLSACSKDKNTGGSGHGTSILGPGAIYYDWAGEGILKFDLSTGIVSTAQQRSTDRNGWDISLDGTKYLQAADKDGDFYDTEVYTLTNLSDGTVITSFDKQSGYANHTSPILSHDTKLIAVPPTFDDGLMILDLKGNILHHIAGFQNQEIDRSNVNWMPDNTVIFSIGKKICRTNAAFTQASIVKELNFAEWTDLAVSPDGSKMAFAANNHIWMMNSDGSNLVQVTTSDVVEVLPEFSPDGKWLVLGTDYRTTGVFGHTWLLVVIPADGKLYNVNEGADTNVIPLVRKGKDKPEAASGYLCWR